MGVLVIVFSALLLGRLSGGGAATPAPPSGSCWVMGTLHYTFDKHPFTFTGNCTYTLAKNCRADRTLPPFEVETKNRKEGAVQVPSVETVTVNVPGFNVQMIRSEFGVVRVNYHQWNLPIDLNNGQVKLFQKGLYVVMETDFGLTVQYDWSEYLVVTVPAVFAGSMCGLCGNFNDKKEDDLVTPSGSAATSVTALGESWRVPGVADDAGCEDGCSGQCRHCPLTEVQKLEKEFFCGALILNFEELLGCQPDIDSTIFKSNCVLDLCRGESVNTYLCSTLQGYADICQRSGARRPNWRTPTQCPTPKCPENSHYEFCASGCPATCANTPVECNATCVETCVCDNGFLRSGTKCVPKEQCGCSYEGRYVEAGASFWGDDSCTERYTCAAGGHLTANRTGCPTGQQCQVAGGIRGCYPVDYGTCMVSGDPHFLTFDKERYNFQGTCAYELAGVSSNRTDLELFSVVLQNNGQDKKIGSAVQQVEVKVHEYTFVISREYPGTVMVNGEISNLPMTLNSNKLRLYRSGWFAVIEMASGVKVYYNWNSVVIVTVPSAYRGAMQGLCGNYNLDPKDDMRMRDGTRANSPEAFGQSWKAASLPDCVDGCTGPCPGCNATQRETYNSNEYCGLISDPAGPFRDCHAKVDPAGFLSDCVYDVCLYRGSSSMQCKTLTAYTAACQLQGATVHAWRSAHFCGRRLFNEQEDAQCPSNSHYELCGRVCLRSCQKDSNCGARCMEGCTCDEGYLLSGASCVPAEQCGCTNEGRYYLDGEVFYPDALCQKECACNGTVQCVRSSCGPNEKCAMKNYVRSCQPLGKGVCSISGDPHYNTFDNTTYDFQGTCTYTAAESCRLSGTRLAEFSVAVENEKWYGLSEDPKVSVAKLVAVEVYGNVLILRKNQIGMVWINGVLHHLPHSLHDGTVKVYQEGLNDVIVTDFGLKVTYDLIYHVTATVPGNYRGKTCGLCGNFNDDQSDEFQLPGGNVTEDSQAFGAAWKVPVIGAVCEDGCSGDECPKCDDSKKAAIEAKCAVIADPKGPFAACHGVIDPASYFRNCVYDVCMAKDEGSTVCRSVAAYMLDCQDFGAKIENWRSASFCPLTCSVGSHYETCVLPCTSPCPGLRDTLTCTATCVEGCACDEDYYYNGTGCVPAEQCSCYYKGNTYEVGESVMTDDCHRIHTCQASGLILSQNMTCDLNERCLVKDGVMGCHTQRCVLDANGALTTFSGQGGTVTTPGAYEIIQSCDISPSADWFRVVAELAACAPATNTVLAVYVFFNDVMITVDSKHDVWVNGRPMTQATFSHKDVKVVVSDDTVRISSTSSLQLSFSSTNELAVSVASKAADALCGACGPIGSNKPTPRDPRERLLVSLRGSSPAFAPLNIDQWAAPDFPQCGS